LGLEIAAAGAFMTAGCRPSSRSRRIDPNFQQLTETDRASRLRAAGSEVTSGISPMQDERPMSVTSGTKRKEGGSAEPARLFVPPLITALVIRTFLFQPFNIPSGSMKETLLVGDYLFVSKYSYGYSHYSLPFSPPLFQGRIFASTPERG